MSVAEEIKRYAAILSAEILELDLVNSRGTSPAMDEGYCRGCSRADIGVEDFVGMEVEERHCEGTPEDGH